MTLQRLFRSKLAKRQAAGGGFTEYTVSYSDASPDASYLVTPQTVRPYSGHPSVLASTNHSTHPSRIPNLRCRPLKKKNLSVPAFPPGLPPNPSLPP